MNVLRDIIKGKKTEAQEEAVKAGVDRLNKMYFEAKSSIDEGRDFKVITGSALTPNKKKQARPTIEDQLEKGFANNLIAHSIIKKVSEVASQIPFIVEVSRDKGLTWEKEEGQVQFAIDNPSENITSSEFRINAMIYLLGSGNVYLKRSGKKGASIVSFSEDSSSIEYEVLPSNLVTIRTNAKNEIIRFDFQRNGETVKEKLTPEQVKHVKFLDPTLLGHSSHLGISPLVACWNVIKALNNLSIADASMLDNQGALGVISSKNEISSMTETELENLQEATDGLIGGAENYAKNIVSPTPIDYTAIGMTSSDLQMIEGGRFKERQICTAFGVSSIMFNDVEASTLDNMKIAEKKLYTDSAIPNNEILIRGFSSGMLKDYEQRTGLKYRIKQDTSEIEALQQNQQLEAEKNAKNTESVVKILESGIPEEIKVLILTEAFGFDKDKITEILKKHNEKARD